MGATRVYGIQAEVNPLMRWLLQQGLIIVTVVHVAVGIVAVLLFSLLLTVIRKTAAPHDRYLENAVKVWLWFLVALGLLVMANNLTVIGVGHSFV